MRPSNKRHISYSTNYSNLPKKKQSFISTDIQKQFIDKYFIFILKMLLNEKIIQIESITIDYDYRRYNKVYVIIKVVIKNIILFLSMMSRSNREEETQFHISGWEEGALLPKNTNIPQMNNKTFRSINRRQFMERRRKKENIINYQNSDFPEAFLKSNQLCRSKEKMSNTINHESISSINQLKRQMQNIEKTKGRWEEFLVDRTIQIKSRNGFNSHSALMKAQTEQKTEIPQTFAREIYSCRSNRSRPFSSYRNCDKRSITLTTNSSERTKTIHSRCIKHSLSNDHKQKRSKPKLNITINQIQSKKMKSILQTLMNAK